MARAALRDKDLARLIALDHVSPTTRLLEKRRQMFEVQDALDAQKAQYARHEDSLRQRESEVRKRDLELQDSLIRYNKFLQFNEAKRARAEKRAHAERKLRAEKMERVEVLKSELARTRDENKSLELRTAKNMKYLHYLESVQQKLTGTESSASGEIDMVLKRYNTLKTANADLVQRQKAAEQLNEQRRAEYSAFLKERSNDILHLNNEIARLQKALDRSRKDQDAMETEVHGRIKRNQEKTMELGRVLRAISNLLHRCLSKASGSHAHLFGDAEDGGKQLGEEHGMRALQQLAAIMNFIRDFELVVHTSAEELEAAVAHGGGSNPAKRGHGGAR
jgi:DNA repair exonuclease SbcCD ATPase subunit